MADEFSPLEREIRRLIGVAGPMPVAEYMRLCLTHPQHGYYINRDPFGAGGDFITSPEISQMFGELIGLWMAAVWRQMGAPENVRIIELGPGRGTLMHDALRAAKVVDGFRSAIVRASGRDQPGAAANPGAATWPTSTFRCCGTPTLDEVPAGPSIVIANEFVDALPVHQAVKQDDGWHERVVAIGPDGHLVIAAARDPLPHFETSMPRGIAPGARSARSTNGARTISRSNSGRRMRNEGAALIIDYGHDHFGLGDTLQAVAGHSFTDPLRAPGKADLTAHVDFEALAQCAESMGARDSWSDPPARFFPAPRHRKTRGRAQGERAIDKAADIEVAFSRLIAEGARGMGELFKAIAIAAPALGPLPGFETPS